MGAADNLEVTLSRQEEELRQTWHIGQRHKAIFKWGSSAFPLRRTTTLHRPIELIREVVALTGQARLQIRIKVSKSIIMGKVREQRRFSMVSPSRHLIITSIILLKQLTLTSFSRSQNRSKRRQLCIIGLWGRWRLFYRIKAWKIVQRCFKIRTMDSYISILMAMKIRSNLTSMIQDRAHLKHSLTL
jgi:hypothetical protein